MVLTWVEKCVWGGIGSNCLSDLNLRGALLLHFFKAAFSLRPGQVVHHIWRSQKKLSHQVVVC